MTHDAAKYAADRRARRIAGGRCIDEPDRGRRHGKPYKGKRCRACWRRKKLSS